MVLKGIFFWILGYVSIHLGNAVKVNQIRGIPGKDYPNYQVIPATSFRCSEQLYIPGLYADLETRCQVYHYCYKHRQESFLCPEGTIFNQPILACNYWYSSNCSNSPSFYSVNAPEERLSTTEESYDVTEPIVEKYSNNLMVKIIALYDDQSQPSKLNSESVTGFLEFEDLRSGYESLNEYNINHQDSDSFIFTDGLKNEDDYKPTRNGDVSLSSFTNRLESKILNEDHYPTRKNESSDSSNFANHLESKHFNGGHDPIENSESSNLSSSANLLERKYLNLDQNSIAESSDSSNLTDEPQSKYFSRDNQTTIGEVSSTFIDGLENKYLNGEYNSTDIIADVNLDSNENKIYKDLEEKFIYSEDDGLLQTLHGKIDSKELYNFYESSGNIEEYDPNIESPHSEMLVYDPFVGSIEEISLLSEGIEESNVLLKRSETYKILPLKKTQRRKPIYFDSKPKLNIVTLPTANSRRKRMPIKTSESDLVPKASPESEQIETSTQFSDADYNDDTKVDAEPNISIEVENKPVSFRDTNLEHISLANDYEENGNNSIESWFDIVSEHYPPELGKNEELLYKEEYSTTNSEISEMAEFDYSVLRNDKNISKITEESDFVRYDTEFDEMHLESPNTDETIEADEKMKYVLPQSSESSNANLNRKFPDSSNILVSEEEMTLSETLKREKETDFYYLQPDSEYHYNFEVSKSAGDIQIILPATDENYLPEEIIDSTTVNSFYETDYDTVYINSENTENFKVIPGSPHYNDEDLSEVSELDVVSPNIKYNTELKVHEGDIFEMSTEYISLENSFKTSEENSLKNLEADVRTSKDTNEAFAWETYNSKFQGNVNPEIEVSTEYIRSEDSFSTPEENIDKSKVGVHTQKNPKEALVWETHYKTNFHENMNPEIKYNSIPENVLNDKLPESYEDAKISFDHTETYNIANSIYKNTEDEKNNSQAIGIQEFGQEPRGAEIEDIFKFDTSSQSVIDYAEHNVDENIPLDDINISSAAFDELSEKSVNHQIKKFTEMRDYSEDTSNINELDVDDFHWNRNFQKMKAVGEDLLPEHKGIIINNDQIGDPKPIHLEENSVMAENEGIPFDADTTNMSFEIYSESLKQQRRKKSANNSYQSEVSDSISPEIDMLDSSSNNLGNMKDLSKDFFPNQHEGTVDNYQVNELTRSKENSAMAENEKLPLGVGTSSILYGELSENLEDHQSKASSEFSDYEYSDNDTLDVDGFGVKPSLPNAEFLKEGNSDHGQINDFTHIYQKQKDSKIPPTNTNERIFQDEPPRHNFSDASVPTSLKTMTGTNTVGQKTAVPRFLNSEQNFKSYKGPVLNNADDSEINPFKVKFKQLLKILGYLGKRVKSSLFSSPAAGKQRNSIELLFLKSYVKNLLSQKRTKLRNLKNRPLEWLKSKRLM